jgi:hypothetical protein
MITKITGMITWEETVVQEQHRRELLEEAGRQRLARSVSKNETTFYQLLLGRFGEQLVKWGYRLQARYGTLTRSIGHVETLCQQHDDPIGCQYANIQA